MRWRDLLDHAIGVLRLTEYEFFNLTWGNYQRICEGYIKESEVRWMHTREIIAIIYNVYRGNNPAKSGMDVRPLLIDSINDVEPKMSRQKYERVKRLFE